jgi:2-haloacid dehalogenase
MSMSFDFNFDFITFDCYGTLINWEQGILGALQPTLHTHGVSIADDAVLAAYGQIEPVLQTPYRRYREVLREIVREMGRRSDFIATEAEMDSLPNSLANWQPYPDSVEALRRLKRRYKLAILSNIDDDLFAHSAKLLEVPFDAAITAEQVRSYKPGHAHFQEMLKRCRTTPDRVLHVGQSLYHDVIPAKALGFTTVWIHRAPGYGATRAADVQPDLELRDLRSLADLAERN